MNHLDHAVLAAVRARAEEAVVQTDTPKEFDKLTERLDETDQTLRRRRWVVGVAAVAAAAALVVVGAAVWRQTATPTPAPPVQTPARQFSSTTFGLPFTVIRPAWTDVVTPPDSPTYEDPGWITWTRCPDIGTECVMLGFNRYVTVDLPDRRQPVTRASYLAYLEGLATAGKIDITDRATTTVDGRQATVMSITAKGEMETALGCHADFTCDGFWSTVPGRYAIIDTTGLDGDDAVFVVWTRAGAVRAAEATWLDDFDTMLQTIRFGTVSGGSPSS